MSEPADPAEPDALFHYAEELATDPAYARGQRPPPGPLSPEDAVTMVGRVHDGMDAAAEMRAAGAAKLGRPLACSVGCNACCEEPVQVFLPEALRIAAWLRRPENAAARRVFLDAYPEWRARAGDSVDELGDGFAGDARTYVAAFNAQWQKHVLCAFNQGGLCSIYPVRPLVCRNAHAVETSAHCRGDSGQKPVRLAVSKIDEYVEKARLCLRAAHVALGGPPMRPRSVCTAVRDLVAD
jgi:hypothetical protein